MSEKLVIKVADIKAYLADGVTRLKNDNNYHEDKGSIEEIYSLNPAEVRDLFKEEALKGIRVVPYVPKRWTLIEEEETVDTVEETTAEVVEEVQEELMSQEETTEETPVPQFESANMPQSETTEDNSRVDEAF